MSPFNKKPVCNTRLFNFKVSEFLLKKIEEVAASMEMNKSAYVRSLIYFDLRQKNLLPHQIKNFYEEKEE